MINVFELSTLWLKDNEHFPNCALGLSRCYYQLDGQIHLIELTVTLNEMGISRVSDKILNQ